MTRPRCCPSEFADLEPFAADVVPADRSASGSRSGMASTMDEMQAFYDAFFPRAEEAIAYCDQFPLDDLPRGRSNAAAAAVLARSWCRSRSKRWRQPHVPDSGAAYLDLLDRAERRERHAPSCAPTAGSTSTRARCGRRR